METKRYKPEEIVAAAAGRRRSAAKTSMLNVADQLADVAQALQRDHAELGQMPAQSVHQTRTLAHQPLRWSAVLTGTKRIVGRTTASQIASASAASCLLHLMYALTYCAGINRTSWPSARNSRAQ